MSAPQLVQAVVQAIRTKFIDAAYVTMAIRDIEASDIEVLTARTSKLNFATPEADESILRLVDQTHIAPGRLNVTINASELANYLDIDETRIASNALRITETFRLRRKGVENRIILSDAPPEFDRILISNIVKARNWYSDICKGNSFADIAKRDGTSPRRVQTIIDLAFLSPATLDQIVQGTQPFGLTTDYLVKSGFPANWKEQAKVFATLG